MNVRERAAPYLIAALLGAASVLAFAPAGCFALSWLTLGGLFLLLEKTSQAAGNPAQTMRRGALSGAAFGGGLFVTGVSWIYVSLSVFGGMPPPLAALATLLFCAVLALYPAAAGALYVRFVPHTGWQRSLLFAALWTISEWLRGWMLTGFPWLATGYAQTPPSPLAGFAPVFGVYGLSFLSALLAALLAQSAVEGRSGWREKGISGLKTAAFLAPLGATLLILAGGSLLSTIRWTTADGPPIRVSLLQGNVAQDLKWRPEKFNDSLRAYYRLALDNPAQLTVLPETALPAFLEQVPVDYLDALKQLAERERGDMLFGIALGGTDGYSNGAVSLGVSGQQRYSKSHLVPFGEFVPHGFSWFLALVNIPMSDFTPGAKQQAPLSLAGRQIAVNICYEDAFGEEIIRALPGAGILVNLSNVAWFGDSLAPAQHLQIARLRALETGRMMLRATNTGMTAIVGADGLVRGVLPPFTRAALRGEVQAYTGSTPYVSWGNWPVSALSLLLIAFFIRRKTVSSPI